MRKKVISHIYPTTKLLFVFVMILISIFYDWKFAYFFVLPLCILFAFMDGHFTTYIKRVVAILILFVLLIFFIKILMDNSNSKLLLDLGFLQIREQGIIDGLNQTKILVVLVATMVLFFLTTEMEDLMIALQKLNMSHVVSYVILSTLQLIPEMIKKSNVIMQAQAARGIETKGSIINRMKAFFPSIGPLIISSITDIEDRAITLEVRGFSAETKKSNLKQVSKRKLDTLLTIGILLFAALMIIGRFMA